MPIRFGDIDQALRLTPSASDVVTELNSESIASGIRAANDKRKPYYRFTNEDRYVIATYCMGSTRSYCDSEAFQVEISKP